MVDCDDELPLNHCVIFAEFRVQISGMTEKVSSVNLLINYISGRKKNAKHIHPGETSENSPLRTLQVIIDTMTILRFAT